MNLCILCLYLLSSTLSKCYEWSFGESDWWTRFCFDFLSSGKCLEGVPAPPSLKMTTSESSIPSSVSITRCLTIGSTTNPQNTLEFTLPDPFS